MWSYAKKFSLVFFTGFAAFAYAVGCSCMTEGVLFCAHPMQAALRGFGVGYMAAGFGLWLGLCRECSKKTALVPFFNLSITTGSLLLIMSFFFTNTAIAPAITWAGLSLNIGALVVGLTVQVLDPAYPCPLAVRWPEGGERDYDPHVPATELHRPQRQAVPADDLTRIEGIGPRLQRILNEAGIVSYIGLASQTPQHLRDILEEYRFRAHADPESWPEQARIAAGGDWRALDDFQQRHSQRRVPG